MTQYDDARYLYAIQEIPGDTAAEKMKWIEKLSSDERQASGDLDRVPSELLPLVRVNTAVKRRMHEDIVWALKSDDQTIVNRAFRATWFFDGSHKHLIDDKYFRERIFPYVSLKTRTRLVKTLALTLTGRHPDYARQIFTTVRSVYGLEQAIPLLTACDEDFTYRTITSDNVKLPYGIAKRIFRINPDLIVRYLRLSKSDGRNPFEDNVWTYASLLCSLLKKRLEAFVELYEICELQKRPPPSISMSNTRATIFIKRGTEYLTRKPQLYINILPLNKIPATVIESMLPGLLPELSSEYNTDDIMKYLMYYPEEKRVDLLCGTYRDKYGSELLDSRKHVTAELMKVLPAEERIKQARIMIEWEKDEGIEKFASNYENAWICYFPTEKCIPIIKEEISKARKKEERIRLIVQMIYACKINKDDDALLDTLLYFKTRHKNEDYWLFEHMMDKILLFYDVPHLNDKIWAALSDIIQICYVKHGYATKEMLIAMAYYRLLHSMSITEPIDMFLETLNKRSYYIYFNEIFNKNPQYERKCLTVCIDIIHEKYNTPSWEETKTDFLYRIIEGMYSFNNRCAKSHTAIERLTIKSYPWLMDTIRQIIWNLSYRWSYYNEMKTLLNENEPDLCNDWYPKSKDIVSDKHMTSGAALNVLKQNPQYVLDNWQEYLKVCKKNYFSKKVQYFVRSTRWYKDIPIKFMEQCMLDIKQLNSDNVSSLAILALLIRGESLTKLLDPLITDKIMVIADHSTSRKEYTFIFSLSLVMKLSNPPVPLDFVARLCKGDYLSAALRSLTDLSRRSSLPGVISFACNMSEQRVSVRKHGIRIMFMVASRREIIDFLLSAWQKENHYSIRGVLLEKAQQLFLAEQNSDTWSLLSSFVLSMTLQDEMWFEELIESRPAYGTYIAKYVQLLYDTLESLMTNGLNKQKAGKYIVSLLENISSICDLPDEFTEKLLRKYLFHIDTNISETVGNFTITSYLSPNISQENFAAHIKIFADVFVNEVKNHWDVPHPIKKRYYPTKNVVHKFVKTLVINFLTTNCTNSRIIFEMLDIFSSVLEPQMDPSSYLLLMYAKQWDIRSPAVYGYQLGCQMPELVKTFSPLFISFMADTLNQFLQYQQQKDSQEIILNVMKGLVKAATTESCFIAVTMLPSIQTQSNRNSMIFNELIEDFRKMDHPGIKSVLCNTLNEMNYGHAYFDKY